jgi:hypothetical protein
MSASASRLAALAAALLALACGDPAQYRFGVNLSGLTFAPTSSSEGIYPDTSVLQDPNNPFALYGVHGVTDGGPATKWNILDGSGTGLDLGPVAGFYVWATDLASAPNGESQYYTARMLDHLSRTPGALASPDLAPRVRLMAIAGYQRMLDAFPGAVTYDASGTIAYPLGAAAYLAIRNLDAGVTGGWVLVTGPDGPVAINPGGVTPFDGGT